MIEIIEREFYRFKVNATTFIRMAFWTLADMVECNDGRSVQEKIGDINGISDSSTSPSSNTAASTQCVANLQTKLAFFVSGTLSAGSTSITLRHSNITINSYIDIYNNIYGVSATNVVVGNGYITLTYDAQATSMSVRVRVLNM